MVSRGAASRGCLPVFSALCGVACLLVPHSALATGPIGDNGSRIRTSAYAIDLAAGPPVLGTRALGLGGAYVAIAEGTDGNSQNPAAPAVRSAHSQYHVDYDLGVALTFPSTFVDTDFFNTGRGPTDLRHSDQSEFVLLAPTGNLQFGAWGVGLGFEVQRYGLVRRENPEVVGEEELVRAQISVLRTYLARSVNQGQIVAGMGLHLTSFDVTTRDEIFTRSGNIFTTRGVNLEGGMLWRPNDRAYRAGFALRAPVITEVDSRGRSVAGDVVFGDPDSSEAFYFPRSVKRPWSADIGAAVQLGARPLNPAWIDPVERLRALDRWKRARKKQRRRRLADAERVGPDMVLAVRADLDDEARADEKVAADAEARLYARIAQRYAELSRRYVLLSFAVHIDGRVQSSVGIESFLQQTVDRSGELVTYSPRVGVEGEPIANWLKLRSGLYLEPSRFRGGHPRPHGTVGFDAGLFEWHAFGLASRNTRWRFGAVLDSARAYFSWGISVGAWH
jgi:hypothetical protein